MEFYRLGFYYLIHIVDESNKEGYGQFIIEANNMNFFFVEPQPQE